MLANYSTTLYYFVAVEKAADYFSVSTRRIRALLAEGRLSGEKQGKSWKVRYPYILSTGRRGPHMMQRIKSGTAVRPFTPKSKRNTSS